MHRSLRCTHVPAHVCHESRLEYINRKGWPSYNILGIVDMDIRFTFVGAGLAGSCHDMAVLTNCMEEANYPYPLVGMVACYADIIYIVFITI